MPFQFKPILPAVFKDDAFRVEFLAGLRESGTELAKEFERTTRTWLQDKPKFTPQSSTASNKLTLDVVMVGSEMAKSKWVWINFGTKVRYATMSQDWKSKTQVGMLDSGSGRGRKLFVSKRHPRPGIKARGWNKIIAKEFQKKFTDRMQEAMRKGAQRSGHMLR